MEQIEFDPQERLSHAKKLVAELALNLPEKIYAADLSIKSKIPFKAVPLRETLRYRVAELGEAACFLYEQKKIVSAFIMTRSVQETASMLYWLHKKIDSVVSSNDLGDIDDFLMRAAFGWRDKTIPGQAFNILKAIDEVDKQFPRYRTLYDSLSEFAHPNWSGVHGAYAKTDQKNYVENLGPKFAELPLALGLTCLPVSLEVFKFYYNRLSKLLLSFIAICDADIAKA